MIFFYVLACPSDFEIELISVIYTRFYDIILCFGLSLTLALFKLEFISVISSRFYDIILCFGLSLTLALFELDHHMIHM